MYYIGITGGVGAGKSEVLAFLQKNYNVEVLHSDDLARQLETPGHACYDIIREEFSDDDIWGAEDASHPGKPRIEWKKLADLIYADDTKRQKLDGIVHPAVKEEIAKRVENARKSGNVDVFFLEAALLLEEGYDQICDEIWYIYASKEVRRERLRKSRGYSDEKIDSMLKAQLSDEEFRHRCQVTIDNSYGIERGFPEVKKEMERLLGNSGDTHMIEVKEERPAKVSVPDGAELVYSLDIGTRNVVGTVGYQENEDGFHVIAMSSREHKNRAMLDGQIHDIGMVSDIIRKVTDDLNEQLGFRLHEVCIAAAGRVLRTVTTRVEMDYDEETVVTGDDINTLDLMGVDQAQRDINLDGGPYRFYCVGYSTMKYYLNGELFSNLEGHKATRIEEVIIVTFLPEDVVDGLYSAVERAGLSVMNMTLEPIAAISVAIPRNFRMLNIALIDVGAGTSDICITRDGSIIAYGMIPYAGDELTEVLVQAFLVDFDTAEQIKKDSTEKEEVTYNDIMGISHTISAKDVWKLTDPVMTKITDAVGEKIIDLNGGKPVAAAFVVGGGGKVHGFCEHLSRKIGIVSERVALRGEEVMKNITFPDGVKKDPLFVTPIGICMNYYEQKNNFIMIHFNGEMMKLYDNGHLKIVDAAMQSGMDTSELFPKRGREMHFTVNGEDRMIRGHEGESARVTMNGHEASLNTILIPNATVTITGSTAGEEGSLRIENLDEFTKSFVSFIVNGTKVRCPEFVEVNGELRPGSYEIQNGDDIETRSYYTVGQLAEFMDVEPDPDHQILVNNNVADQNTLIYENFSIEWTLTGNGYTKPEEDTGDREEDIENTPEEEKDTDEVTESEPTEDSSTDDGDVTGDEKSEQSAAAERTNSPDVPSTPLTKEAVADIPKKAGNEIHVKFNGEDVTLSGRLDYIFADVLAKVNFDANQANGRLALTKKNGVKCGYADPITEGDDLAVEFVEKS